MVFIAICHSCRDCQIEGIHMMECNHVVKFFDSTMEGRLHYTE